MKNCPYCGEQILHEAKKCKFCHEWLEKGEYAHNHKTVLGDDQIRLSNLESKLLIISCVMLGIAIIWFGGYGFYILSRLVIFVIMIVLFIKNYKYKLENERKLWLYGITGFVYNPIFSIYLTRPIRTVIDVTLMILFIQTIRQNKKSLVNN